MEIEPENELENDCEQVKEPIDSTPVIDNTFEGILKFFKSKELECLESVVPLMDDTILRNGIAAWQSVVICRKDAVEPCQSVVSIDRWNWAWNQVSFNVQPFSVVCGVPVHEIVRLFDRLKGLKLIYPDGTINNQAKLYMHQLAQSKLKKHRSVNDR